jgi:hypothetical protein
MNLFFFSFYLRQDSWFQFPFLLSRSIEKMESWVTEVVRRWEGERVGKQWQGRRRNIAPSPSYKTIFCLLISTVAIFI